MIWGEEVASGPSKLGTSGVNEWPFGFAQGKRAKMTPKAEAKEKADRGEKDVLCQERSHRFMLSPYYT
jgi:hypothetical protein